MSVKSSIIDIIPSSVFKKSPDELQPYFDALISAFSVPIEEIQTVLDYLETNRKLENAEGVWLDNVGQILGYPRPGVLEDDDNIFTFSDLPIFSFNVGGGSPGATLTLTIQTKAAVSTQIEVYDTSTEPPTMIEVEGTGDYVETEISYERGDTTTIKITGDMDDVTGLFIEGMLTFDLSELSSHFINLEELEIVEV